jgi:miniconductance mechanosensitive channel
MELFNIKEWIAGNPAWATAAAGLLFVLILLLARLIFGRGLVYLTTRTKNKYDDIIVKGLRPLRASLLAPFIIAFVFSDLALTSQDLVKKLSLFFILWISILTINGLLDAFNEIYESTPSFNGVSIQGYLDIGKIFLFMVAVILSISLVTDESPILLLSGLGAMTAVLLLVFQDTIMAFIASIQISVNNLVKEGDWLEVPSYDADGIVTNMSLHAIKIQNWDKTITVIPTSKIMDTSYKNWRGMEESGGRRIMRSIRLDLNSVKFCTPEMIECYSKIDMISAYVEQRRSLVDDFKNTHRDIDSPLDGPQVTNMEFFREYIEVYLNNHPDIHTENMDFIIRELEPSSTGLPVEIYVFTRTTQWKQYERIQGEVVDHLLAAASFFDLRLFQEPAGSDFASAFQRV